MCRESVINSYLRSQFDLFPFHAFIVVFSIKNYENKSRIVYNFRKWLFKQYVHMYKNYLNICKKNVKNKIYGSQIKSALTLILYNLHYVLMVHLLDL